MNGINLVYYEENKIKINYIVLTEILRICAAKESYYFAKILPEHIESAHKKKCPSDDSYTKEVWELDNIRNVKVEDVIMLGVGKPEEWKLRYYTHYFSNLEKCKDIRDVVCKDHIKNLCHNYFEGLEWVTKYYFEGCPSWMWQYKWTHSPFISDLYYYLKNNPVNITFKKDKPLEPCVQLLSVLPPACHKELPKKYQPLVTSMDSPIKDMFPETKDIVIDMIHMDQLWQCIPMIPYLDVNRIKEECSKYKLSKNDMILNKIFDEIKY